MKFTTLPTLYLFMVLVTPTITTASVDSPTSTLLSSLVAKLTSLDTAISSYTGGDTSTIQFASGAIIITIDRGLHDIQNGPDLTPAATKSLSPQFQALKISLEAAIIKINNKKPLFEAACAGTTIQKSLHNQHVVLNKLFDLVSSKSPQPRSSFIVSTGEGILAAIQTGIDTYVDVPDICSTDTATPAILTRIGLLSNGKRDSIAPRNNTSTISVPVPTLSVNPGTPAFTGAAAATVSLKKASVVSAGWIAVILLVAS
ncbi:hydrophobic surface binding protein A-domain-containing protein [Aspergillus cavernicola]|uniref:Hydrophobic surface binding protein A-domain-containing protein n=1 Tax=Aspergillus cavernicola TaxID=176166 RepID=A0ABR4HUX7_9EURO